MQYRVFYIITVYITLSLSLFSILSLLLLYETSATSIEAAGIASLPSILLIAPFYQRIQSSSSRFLDKKLNSRTMTNKTMLEESPLQGHSSGDPTLDFQESAFKFEAKIHAQLHPVSINLTQGNNDKPLPTQHCLDGHSIFGYQVIRDEPSRHESWMPRGQHAYLSCPFCLTPEPIFRKASEGLRDFDGTLLKKDQFLFLNAQYRSCNGVKDGKPCIQSNGKPHNHIMRLQFSRLTQDQFEAYLKKASLNA